MAVKNYLWSDRSGTRRKKINLFSKKLVFMPINVGNLHWVFLVLINLGNILQHSAEAGPKACALFFDSLNGPLGQLKINTVLELLNSQWNQLNKKGKHSPFTKETFPIFQPKGKILLLAQLSIVSSNLTPHLSNVD